MFFIPQLLVVSYSFLNICNCQLFGFTGAGN